MDKEYEERREAVYKLHGAERGQYPHRPLLQESSFFKNYFLKKMILLFSWSNCPNCMIGKRPFKDVISEKLLKKGVKSEAYDFEENGDVFEEHDVTTIPTIIISDSGKEVRLRGDSAKNFPRIMTDFYRIMKKVDVLNVEGVPRPETEYFSFLTEGGAAGPPVAINVFNHKRPSSRLQLKSKDGVSATYETKGDLPNKRELIRFLSRRRIACDPSLCTEFTFVLCLDPTMDMPNFRAAWEKCADTYPDLNWDISPSVNNTLVHRPFAVLLFMGKISLLTDGKSMRTLEENGTPSIVLACEACVDRILERFGTTKNVKL
jgi:hypothetical protein